MQDSPVVLTGIKDVLKKVHPKPQAVFLDLWGVVHDGHAVYPGAIDALKELHQAGVAVVFVSNTSVRAESARQRLDALGIPRELYIDVVTAGEVAFQHLSEIEDKQKYYYIGPPQNNILAGINNFIQMTDPARADFVLASGFTPEKPSLKELEPELAACAQYNLPMICQNPDEITVSRTGEIANQGGQIGLQYQNITEKGVEVSFFGKPFPEVYDMALKLVGVPRSRVVIIGDSPSHDIIGGNANGFTTVLVSGTGIMQKTLGRQPSPKDISTACLEHTGLDTHEDLKGALNPKDIIPGTVRGMVSDPIPKFVIPAFAVNTPESLASEKKFLQFDKVLKDALRAYLEFEAIEKKKKKKGKGTIDLTSAAVRAARFNRFVLDRKEFHALMDDISPGICEEYLARYHYLKAYTDQGPTSALDAYSEFRSEVGFQGTYQAEIYAFQDYVSMKYPKTLPDFTSEEAKEAMDGWSSKKNKKYLLGCVLGLALTVGLSGAAYMVSQAATKPDKRPNDPKRLLKRDNNLPRPNNQWQQDPLIGPQDLWLPLNPMNDQWRKRFEKRQQDEDKGHFGEDPKGREPGK